MEHMHMHGGDGGHGGGGMDMGDSCPMIMSFHAGHCETILWKSWTASSTGSFFLSALAIFGIAFVYEGLKYLREKFYHVSAQEDIAKMIAMRKEAGPANGVCCPRMSNVQARKTIRQKIFNKAHLLQTLMHLIQVAVSYLLMLIIMTYNYWLCLAIILGAAAGYFCFGWIRQQAIDLDEHCQ